jgi:hypothetical protein
LPAEIARQVFELDRDRFERRSREAGSTYTAGTCDRMNPMPQGIDPLGTDADYHYRTEFNYFLMVERARTAVRNHPLGEQGVNRLLANMRLDEMTLDVSSGDPAVDADQKAFWYGLVRRSTTSRLRRSADARADCPAVVLQPGGRRRHPAHSA